MCVTKYQPSVAATLRFLRPIDAADGLAFYNSLNRSIISRMSHQATPISTLQRATPISATAQDMMSYHRAMPVISQDEPRLTRYQPPTPWKDNMGYRTDALYYVAADYGSQGAFPATGYNVPSNTYYSYLPSQYPADDLQAKYSTGSADSGVHSDSPIIQNGRLIEEREDDQQSSQQSLNGKIVKNETYV